MKKLKPIRQLNMNQSLQLNMRGCAVEAHGCPGAAVLIACACGGDKETID